ncbi:hypothetical protein E1B28_012662 [Marasmius oreades]|nr:uncharacterized protein E1B28_012662 [Marasmius oreades]KAG7088692.1 hypothetical protein E1B28_012662 [Marasmius oreades]
MKETKSKRGWEKASAHGVNAPGRQGGWVARSLVGLLESRAHKVQEAALLALAALAKDNPPVASALTETEILTSVINAFARSRIADVQLAGCLCATHIIRACPLSSDATASTIISVVNRFISPPSTIPAISPQQQLKSCYILYHLVIDDVALCKLAFSRGCLLNLAGLLSSLTVVPVREPQTRSSISNDTKGSSPSSSSDIPEDLTDEPPTLSALREAALIALTALALLAHDIRMSLTELDLGDVTLHPALVNACVLEPSQPTKQHKQLLPLLRWTLLSPHTGVRYATAELIRALTRSVAVLRTSVVDSGLGTLILERVMDKQEDRRVIGSALKAVCNGVCEFSPLRSDYVNRGLIGRLVEFIRGVETHRPGNGDEGGMSEGLVDTSLRPIALWAIKNLVRKSSDQVKTDVMTQLGWKNLAQLMASGKLESHGRHRGRRRKSPRGKTRRESVSGGIMGFMDIDVNLRSEEFSDDTETEAEAEAEDQTRKAQQDTAAVQEQAINIVRNLSEDENGIDMIFEEFGKLDLAEISFDSTKTTGLSIPVSTSVSPSRTPFPSLLSPELSDSTHATSSQPQPHPIVAILTRILSAPPTSLPEVTLQATYTLANLANGSPLQQALILNHPPILRAVRDVIAESGRGFEGRDARKPAIGVVLALAKGCAGVVGSIGEVGVPIVISSVKCRQEMIDAGVVGTLKRICESQGGVVGVGIGVHHRGSLGHSHSSVPSTSPATPVHLHSYSHSSDADKVVLDLAKQALDWLDHGEGYGGLPS